MNSPIRLILKWAGPDRKYLIAAVVFAFVSGLMAMVPYYGVYEIMKAAYEGTCTWEVITSNALVVAVGVCIQYACFGCAGALSHKGAYNTLFRVRCRVVDHLAHAPLGQLDERSTGSIKTVLSDDIEKLELFLAHNITEAIMYLTGPVAAFIFLCSVNVPLALATLVPFAAAFVVMGVIFKRMAGVMPRASAALSRMNAVMVEYVRGMRVIKALNMGSKSFRRFQSAVDEEHAVWCDIARKTGPGFAAFVIIIECGMLVMVPLGGFLFSTGAISGSTFLLFAFVGSLYLTEIRLLQEIGSKYAQVKSGAIKAQELLDLPAFAGGAPFPAKSDVRLENVRFSYDGTREVLHGVNLAVQQGERLAVVGQRRGRPPSSSSCPASTMRPRARCVSVAWTCATSITTTCWRTWPWCSRRRSSRAAASSRTSGWASAPRWTRCAKRRGSAHRRLHHGAPRDYDTEIGTLGERLSGGQRQRIAIARAILKDAPVLILDEATSAADPENQVQIDEAIANLCAGRTVVIVAHRLGVVRTCDRVAVVEDGGISAVGTHDEVLAACPYYRKAWADYERTRRITFGFGAAAAEAEPRQRAATIPSTVPPRGRRAHRRRPRKRPRARPWIRPRPRPPPPPRPRCSRRTATSPSRWRAPSSRDCCRAATSASSSW
ncbi:MAG: ABC transporter ATP-binding protein [Eggerthella lenta]